ncbi:MAG: hypothetical protein EO766_10715 [Hydrotalea sp. AMD]|uniref:hypothetical protein n=1 Tax=Hydrotalea TaxID=1004300 RepID=UPI000941DCC8|nr:MULTISPECIES: hypothetical protein [Hydrotalea]RWZ87589.1 MAG: hypothetical protein EO766_10715 [Hydrotalea sp. AMD]
MKKLLLLFSFVNFFSIGYSQSNASDSSGSKWHPSVGINLEPVPVYDISGADTSFVNSFSIAPYFSYRNDNGIGIMYSPKFVMGGATPGIYVHVITAGIEQYGKKVWDYVLDYSHYFFTGNTSIPYTPLNNEIYSSLTYKKSWIRPFIQAGVGFGKDTENVSSTSAYDVGATIGISHAFSWDKNNASYLISPSVTLNAGTNQYFSLLNITKYIGRSTKFTQIVKNSVAAAAATRSATANRRGRNTGGSSPTGGGTTTTTTTSSFIPAESFNLNNIGLGIESEIDLGSFGIRPTANVYLPVSSFVGIGAISYWQLSFEYNF